MPRFIFPIGTALIGLSLLTLTGCTDANTSPGVRGDDGIRRRTWTDPETGCQFHFWEIGIAQTYAMALAPRIGADGLPVCRPKQ